MYGYTCAAALLKERVAAAVPYSGRRNWSDKSPTQSAQASSMSIDSEELRPPEKLHEKIPERRLKRSKVTRVHLQMHEDWPLENLHPVLQQPVGSRLKIQQSL